MSRSAERRTLIIVSLALFMVVLDNLVVTVALPSIRHAFGAGVQSLEWTVNAYTLSYAVLLLTGAALGDRFGRRLMFIVGLAIFTVASAAAALAPDTGLLIAARAIQGSGAAIATPLTLTLLAEAFPLERRGMALGVWSAIGGVAVAMGPLVGGAVITLLNWHWIFWINVPVGLVVLPFAARGLSESHGPYGRLDLPGLALGSGGLLGVVYGLVHSQSVGFGATTVVAPLAAGIGLLGAFVLWELRAESPMLPMGFFAERSFLITNLASLAMYFGMFGSIFFLTQDLQIVLHNSPLHAGLKLLVWTGTTMVVAPIAGVLSARWGSRPFLAAGLASQALALALLAATASTHTPYTTLLLPFVLAGGGMGLFFAPAASAVLAAVNPNQAGQASGANNTIREVGGVFGVAVLASVFSSHGSYASGHAFVSGIVPALWVGVAVLGAFAALVAIVPWRSVAVSQAPASTSENTAAALM
ncbi:MAG: MFS transporter [Solirubrobacteraceae bacterium]